MKYLKKKLLRAPILAIPLERPMKFGILFGDRRMKSGIKKD